MKTPKIDVGVYEPLARDMRQQRDEKVVRQLRDAILGQLPNGTQMWDIGMALAAVAAELVPKDEANLRNAMAVPGVICVWTMAFLQHHIEHNIAKSEGKIN